MLKHLFGDSSMVRILDFLLDEWELDFSKADVAREAGVTWKTVNELWSKLEEFGLIEYTRTVNRAKMYRINKNALFKALKKLDMEILKILDEKELKEVEVVA
jgi:transcription initiation factor IIE alpha subunit